MRYRRLGAILTALWVCVLVIGVRQIRDFVLRSAGSLLVSEDNLRSTQAVALLTGIGSTGLFEVIDLVHEGRAAHVAVMEPDEAPEIREFERRGLPFETQAAWAIGLLEKSGIPRTRVAVIAAGEGGTTAEVLALRRWCLEQQVSSVIVVASRHHSARVRRALWRTFREGRPYAVVRIARHDSFDPAEWWKHWGSLRTGIIELQKLMLDYVRHPLTWVRFASALVARDERRPPAINLDALDTLEPIGEKRR